MVDPTTKLIITGGGTAIAGLLVWKNWDKISKTAMGAILAGTGLGLALVGQQYFKETKPAKIGLTYGGLAVTGLGTYFIAEPYIKQLLGYRPATGSDRVSVAITSPEPGTNWCHFGKGKVKARVKNVEDKMMQVYVGFTIVHEETGQYQDYALRSVALDPMESAEAEWSFSMNDLPEGNWSIHVACWNKAPIRGKPDPSVVMLADDSVRISTGLWYCAIW